MRDKVDAVLDRDLIYNVGETGVNLSKFYKWSEMNFSKLAFSSSSEKKLSDADKQKKLRDHDETFINRDPDFSCDIAAACSVNPEQRFSIADWDPSKDELKLAEFIRSRKKIDKFYKINATLFAPVIFIILNMMSLKYLIIYGQTFKSI